MLLRHNKRRRVGPQRDDDDDDTSGGSSEHGGAAPSEQASGARGAATMQSRAGARQEAGRTQPHRDTSRVGGMLDAQARLIRTTPVDGVLPPPPPLPSLEMVEWDHFINECAPRRSRARNRRREKQSTRPLPGHPGQTEAPCAPCCSRARVWSCAAPRRAAISAREARVARRGARGVPLLRAACCANARPRRSEGMQTLFRDLPASGDPSMSTGAFAAALLGYAPGPPPAAQYPPLQQQHAPAAWAAPPQPFALAALPNGPALVMPLAPAGGDAVAAQQSMALLHSVVTHIKLHELSPAQLPPQVAQAVRAWLGPAVLDALSYVRPGCTLLSVHALTWRGADVGAAGPEALQQALRAIGATGAIDVRVRRAGDARPLPPLRPLAVCTSGAAATLQSSAPAGAAGALRAYCCGQTLAVEARAARGAPVALRLPPASACMEGLLMVELQLEGDDGALPRLRPVLLTRDAAVAAEVAAALGALEDDAEAEGCILALGHALTVGAPAAVVRLAAEVAAARGLGATLQRLCAPLAALGACPPGTDTPLHAAARSGDAGRVQRARTVLGCGAGVPSAVGVRGATPLHAAASLPAPEPRAAMLRELCSPDDGTAPLAWLASRDGSGATPAQLAAAHAGAHDATGALDAELRMRLAGASGRARAALRSARDTDGFFIPEMAAEVAAERLTAQGDADAAALLCATLQLPHQILSADDAPAPSPRRRALANWAIPRLRLRMPGSFPDAAMETAWLQQTAMHRRWLDAHAFGFSALIHLFEVARSVATGEASPLGVMVVNERVRFALQLLYCLLLLLALPALCRRAPAWYVPWREHVIIAVRLGAAYAAPLWVGPPAVALGRVARARSSRAAAFGVLTAGGWLGRLPLLALPVRWPLQAAVSAASFLLVLPRGANAAVGPRSWATALNVAIVFAFERSSRTHFAANRGQLRAAKGAKGE
jgi:hypothetical protein